MRDSGRIGFEFSVVVGNARIILRRDGFRLVAVDGAACHHGTNRDAAAEEDERPNREAPEQTYAKSEGHAFTCCCSECEPSVLVEAEKRGEKRGIVLGMEMAATIVDRYMNTLVNVAWKNPHDPILGNALAGVAGYIGGLFANAAGAIRDAAHRPADRTQADG